MELTGCLSLKSSNALRNRQKTTWKFLITTIIICQAREIRSVRVSLRVCLYWERTNKFINNLLQVRIFCLVFLAYFIVIMIYDKILYERIINIQKRPGIHQSIQIYFGIIIIFIALSVKLIIVCRVVYIEDLLNIFYNTMKIQ